MQLGRAGELAKIEMWDRCGLDRAVDLAAQNSYLNPRAFEQATVFGLLHRELNGEPPG